MCMRGYLEPVRTHFMGSRVQAEQASTLRTADWVNCGSKEQLTGLIVVIKNS